jgi:hypothetical protein
MRYTAELYDDEDMRPHWCVVEWEQTGEYSTGKTIERCTCQWEAESLAQAYQLIHALTH